MLKIKVVLIHDIEDLVHLFFLLIWVCQLCEICVIKSCVKTFEEACLSLSLDLGLELFF
jgi:hypothetical protein